MIPLLQTQLPPSNLPYLIAIFVITGLVFIGYIAFIFRRRQEARAEIGRLRRVGEADENAGQDSP